MTVSSQILQYAKSFELTPELSIFFKGAYSEIFIFDSRYIKFSSMLLREL